MINIKAFPPGRGRNIFLRGMGGFVKVFGLG